MRTGNKKEERTYGYEDKTLVAPAPKNKRKWLSITMALLLILAFWMMLDQKLLFGQDWISPTYDNPDWRTNEGNLHTFGAWDIETHIWKTEYIIDHFPHFHWNPYWYLGMPLYKYYQLGFYAVNIGLIMISGLSAARSTLMLVIFGHLLATLLTFALGYKVSRRVWPSALAAIFLLANTFISLRSYGWEPITVAFLFLYPLGLLVFLKDPLRPLRFWMIITLTAAYLFHPLIWLSLDLTMGVYLLSIALRPDVEGHAKSSRYLWELFAAVGLSLVVGAVQFLPQISYQQVTSGAHMGVTYLPYYQVPFNIISVKDFFFDAGNLKGPGPIVAVAAFFAIAFTIIAIRDRRRKRQETKTRRKDILGNELVFGLLAAITVMIALYYMELYRLFPMNLLQSTQYHRVIPEMVILSAAFIASVANVIRTKRQKVLYYAVLFSFLLASVMVILNVQSHWVTSKSISDSPEFLEHNFTGRITFPYTDQSLSVRSSFTGIPQLYGYFEQGITNPYADEGFSVSSGFHSKDLTLLYLRAMNVERLYVNTQEGKRDQNMMAILNSTMTMHKANDRYSYFTIGLADPSFAQAVDQGKAEAVRMIAPGCRELFEEHYCGSSKEEFVRRDPAEIAYLGAYVDLLGQPYDAKATMTMIDPDTYRIHVHNATQETAVVVKMTYDKDFRASVNGEEKPISDIGPYFMLISPQRAGDYDITLTYTPRIERIGAIISIAALLILIGAFTFRRRIGRIRLVKDFPEGDM